MNQDTKQQRNHPFDTIFQELAEAVQEIDRLKAEVKQLRGCLPSIDTYKLAMDERSHFAQECERLKAENARLVAALRDIEDHPDAAYTTIVTRCHDALYSESSTALRDLLAPTVELLDNWRFQLQSALNQKTCLVLDAVDLEKLVNELSRLTALMEGKV